jgi:hypothetical protein
MLAYSWLTLGFVHVLRCCPKALQGRFGHRWRGRKLNRFFSHGRTQNSSAENFSHEMCAQTVWLMEVRGLSHETMVKVLK